MNNAVIYARFSSHSQNEQSIEGQMKECRAFAERYGYKIIGEYIDRALTGTTDKRPEFLRMIEDSRKKQFQFVIVYQLDRFARNRYDSATYKAKLKKNGVRVLSAKENITDDASGVLVEGVLESMAEYYSLELSQKIKRGIGISASKCKFFGGSIALGYKVDEEKNYVVDEHTAPLVKTVFEMFVGGHNYATIARYLNERGIPTSKGGRWNKSSFQRIFSNRRYLGKYIYHGNEIDGGIPRLIDDGLFEQAQGILAKLAQAPSRGKAKIEYLLSEDLLCGHCGSNMTGISSTSRSKKIHHYYKCVGVTNNICGKRTIRKQFIEDEIIKAVAGDGTEQNKYGLLTDGFVDLIAAETYLLIQAENNDVEIKRLESLVSGNQKAINNLMQALMLGRITDTIMAQIEKLENTNKELKDTIACERALRIEYSYNDIRKWLLHFRTLDYSKIKNRRDLIDTLIYKVILYDDKMKILFNLKGGQKGELLLNLIFPDYPDGDDHNGTYDGGSDKNGGDGNHGGLNDGTDEKTGLNEKETDRAVSLSERCAYTSRVVEMAGVAPASDMDIRKGSICLFPFKV
ncbi:recombinase RecD [Clostridia bacterium]|nr:recombinase RecD [Clostridia bacterium]